MPQHFQFKKTTKSNRKRSDESPHIAKVVGCSETIRTCGAIHGCSDGNIQPAVIGRKLFLTNWRSVNLVFYS